MVIRGDTAAGGGGGAMVVGGDAAAGGGGAMVGSLGEEVPCGGLFLPARHRSPTQRYPRLPGGGGEMGKELEAEFERVGQRLERNSIYARQRNWGRRWCAGKICRAGALGSRRRSRISGMKRSALSGVSWSYRDVGNWSNTVSSPRHADLLSLH